MITLAIDPGVHRCGYAVARDGEVLECGLFNPSNAARLLTRPDRAIVEGQYASPARGFAANNMLDVAFTAGLVLGYFDRSVRRYRVPPRIWKGTVPKAVHQKKILAAIPSDIEDELKSLPIALRHNIVDAIGIALWSDGRDLEHYRIPFGGYP